MNQITELFNNINDVELRQSIIEIQEGSKDGIIKVDGIVRKYAKILSDITNNSVSTNLFMVELNLLQVAAYRWANTDDK